MDEYYAVQLLAEIKRIFAKYNIEYWLDAGTLLGAVRDGKFIPWDEDIDLGTWHENIPKLISISNELRKKGFEVSLNEHSCQFIIKKNESKLEVILYSLINKKATHTLFITRNWVGANLASLHLRLSRNINTFNSKGQTCLKTKLKRPIIRANQMLPTAVKKTLARICFFLYEKIGLQRFLWVIPSEYFTNLSEIKFYGMNFKAPSKINKYLTLRYGEKWHIPDEKWIYYKDVPTLALKREKIKNAVERRARME